MPNTRKCMNKEEIKRFIFAGKASITMFSTEYDFKMVYRVISSSKNNKKMWFVSINAEELPKTRWLYVGYVPDHNHFALVTTKNSKFAQFDKEWFVFVWLLGVALGIYEHLSIVRVTHNDFCGRCGHHLTDDKSVERGFGPVCWKHV